MDNSDAPFLGQGNRQGRLTVSIAAETIGIFRGIRLVRRLVVSASVGIKSLRAGISKTSSKVIPSPTIFSQLAIDFLQLPKNRPYLGTEYISIKEMRQRNLTVRYWEWFLP